MKKIYIVYKYWPTGKIERVKAYFNEDKARIEASQMIGKENCTIGLEELMVEGEE